jgi:hypothetical protein
MTETLHETIDYGPTWLILIGLLVMSSHVHACLMIARAADAAT